MNAAPSPFMALAIEAAATARGATSPNPWVGAVLVRDGRPIASGATQPPPGLHAEAAAFAAAGAAASGADLYTTLEPCTPFPGKRTPSCAEAAVAAGVRRVVIALQDPDPNVAGRGIALLRAAGVAVEIGDGAEAVTRQLRPYLKHRQTGLPYVIAKWAASLDGRTSTAGGDSKWITGEAARDRAHHERARVDAVMVGSGTVLADDPALTARPAGIVAARQPLRVILDSRGRIPSTARLFAEPGRVIVATSAAAPGAWKKAVAAADAHVILCESTREGIDLDQLFAVLGARGIMSLWAEGGATLLGSLFDGAHVDEVWAFLAPLVIGGGSTAVAGTGAVHVAAATALYDVESERLGADLLVRGYTTNWRP
ncbi:MAG: bifunctional diaminohydroxyphosphoribosylaminopyrimidine deaminase/5-amino-6-(5-phosphoribosylamino)uracil reductase RibD [Tepidiformaceae bacterium]